MRFISDLSFKIYSLLKRKEHFLPILLFFLITFIVITIWFMPGKLMTTGEEGILFYNPLRTYTLFNSVWYQAGTGQPMPVLLPRAWYYFVLSFIFFIIPSSISIQIIIFWFLLFSGMVSFYIFVIEYLGKDKRLIGTFAALFYFFNLYTMSQIWGRFLLTNIFAWSYLPLFAILVYKICRNFSFIYIFLFSLSSVIFSYTYGMPAMILNLWLVAGMLVFGLIIQDRKRSLLIFFRFLGLIVLWIAVNIWWIYPYFKLSSNSFSLLSKTNEIYNSLVGVSQYFPIQQILILRQSFLFGIGSPLFLYYSANNIQLLSYLVLAIAILGIVYARREKTFVSLLLLFIIGLFLCKGSNPPLGAEFYKNLFNMFPSMGVIRNPYEKLGMIIVVPYAIFFAFGVQFIYQIIYQKLSRVISIVFLCLTSIFIFGVLVLPYWTGGLFASDRITIPSYYRTMDHYISDLHTNKRIVVAPLINGDGVAYTWGYRGIEPSEYLFSKQMIARILRTAYFDDKYNALYNSFVQKNGYNEVMSDMNAGYILLHDDLEEKITGTSSSAVFKNMLIHNASISLVKSEGKLHLYKVNNSSSLISVHGVSAPRVSYKEISPTLYKVAIYKATKPYLLIFKSTFNPLWKASINNQQISSHTLYDQYANAWRIDKKGSYAIVLSFKIWPWE